MSVAPVGPLFESLRPRQWTKNLILFAGVIFSQRLTDPDLTWRAAAGFVLFCMISSAVYIFNDIRDIEHDRRHPHKMHRPLASGRLARRPAEIAAALLAGVALVVAWRISLGFAVTAALYFLLNVAYTHLLKRVPIVDVVVIALGFVLRAVASVEVLRGAEGAIALSNWLILCTFLLALFLGFAKRRAEFLYERPAGQDTRPTLRHYNELTLNLLIGGTFATTVGAYVMYTISPRTVEHFQTRGLLLTVPFVIWGLGRYLALVFREQRGGRPHEVLLTDGWIQLAILGWIGTVFLLIGVWS